MLNSVLPFCFFVMDNDIFDEVIMALREDERFEEAIVELVKRYFVDEQGVNTMTSKQDKMDIRREKQIDKLEKKMKQLEKKIEKLEKKVVRIENTLWRMGSKNIY